MANGFGVDPFGQPPLGLDAVDLPERHRLTPIAAKRYDATRKEYVLNIDGQYVEEHPVDQFVIHQCTLQAGSIRSTPSIGNPAFRHTHLTPRFEAQVKADLLAKLAPKVASRELQVLRIVVSRKDDRGLIGVDYRNLVTGRQRAQWFS